jgi:predicted nucleotidyltransferase
VERVTEHVEPVDALLIELLQIAGTWPQAQFGVYLHGRRTRGEERTHSDVDVLALADPSTPPEIIDAFVTAGRACTAPLAQRLDLKAFTTTRFAAEHRAPRKCPHSADTLGLRGTDSAASRSSWIRPLEYNPPRRSGEVPPR